MTKLLYAALIVLFFVACKKDVPLSDSDHDTYISAVDVSSFPEINNTNTIYYDSVGNEIEFLPFLKSAGINTIRLRLWVNPLNGHSGFHEVSQFSNEIRSHGLNVWLTLHYSDTWADPAHQQMPHQWQGITYNSLKDSVYEYTRRVVQEMNPNFVQIGNEINSGFLHPQGRLADNQQQFIDLMDTAIASVRYFSPSTQIILHFAGIEGAGWFFNQLTMLDFDIIGLSYYPIWHGKSLVIYHDDPNVTIEDKLRMSVCVTITAETKVDGEIGKMEIEAAKYVIARFEVTAEDFQQAWSWIYGQWLPSSGYQPDDKPCFEMYPEEPKDGKFIVDICVPVKPM